MNWHKSDSFAPLILVFHGQQKYRSIRSLRQMAEVLIAAWPSFDGEEYLTAAKICLDAHLGTCSVNEARIALIRAAAEANIPVITVVPRTSSPSCQEPATSSPQLWKAAPR